MTYSFLFILVFKWNMMLHIMFCLLRRQSRLSLILLGRISILCLFGQMNAMIRHMYHKLHALIRRFCLCFAYCILKYTGLYFCNKHITISGALCLHTGGVCPQYTKPRDMRSIALWHALHGIQKQNLAKQCYYIRFCSAESCNLL